MSLPLFRREVLHRLEDRRHGEVLLARPLTHAFLTAFFAIVAGGVIAFLACFSVTRKAQIPGMLLPLDGLIRVAPAQAGLVVERSVGEGQAVEANQVLFVLASERDSARQGNAEQTIAGLLESRRDSLLGDHDQVRRQSAQRIAAARRRIRDVAESVVHLDRQLALQRERVTIAEAVVSRHAELEAARFISAAQVQDRQADLLDQRQRVADLERLRASAGRELAVARDDLAELIVQARRDEAGAQRGLALVEQERAEHEARRRSVVRAPQAGTVTAITAELGQTVAAAQPIAAILPAGSRLEAELYAPSRAAGFLKPGMPVRIRYQGYAYQKFGQAQGTVREVSRSALRPEELPLPGAVRSSTGEPVYRVRVALASQTMTAYGAGRPLKSGELLDASVLLETRRLYEWILEPLYTVTGRV
jgi:membrane fusion protein